MSKKSQTRIAPGTLTWHAGVRMLPDGQGMRAASQSSWAMFASPPAPVRASGTANCAKGMSPSLVAPRTPLFFVEIVLIPATAISAMKAIPTISE